MLEYILPQAAAYVYLNKDQLLLVLEYRLSLLIAQ